MLCLHQIDNNIYVNVKFVTAVPGRVGLGVRCSRTIYYLFEKIYKTFLCILYVLFYTNKHFVNFKQV